MRDPVHEDKATVSFSTSIEDETLDDHKRTARIQIELQDYEILGEIARGGMGVIYKARQRSLDRLVAIKMILAGSLASEKQIERFKREARAAAKLEHPNIVEVYQVDEADGQHFFSMAYIDGRSLADWLKENGPLRQKQAAEIALGISRAVEYAHSKGVVHRDLKPANVLISADGSPKLVDFGLAKVVTNEDITATGAILGTPGYMSPEQATGSQDEVGVETDIYAIGAVLYTMLTGRPPFQDPNVANLLISVRQQLPLPPRRLTPNIDQDIETICLKCLEKPPTDRYQSAQALAEDLARYLADEPISIKPVGIIRSAWRWYTGQRESAIWVAGGYSMIVGLFLCVWNTTGIVAVLALERYDGTRLRAITEQALSIALQCIPMMFIGYYSLRKSRIALLLGTLFAFAMLTFTFSLWTGVIKMVAQQQSHDFDPLSALLMTLALFGALLFSIAIYTHFSQRRR